MAVQKNSVPSKALTENLKKGLNNNGKLLNNLNRPIHAKGNCYILLYDGGPTKCPEECRRAKRLMTMELESSMSWGTSSTM